MGDTQAFSKKIILKRSYVKQDGTCPLYIYVAIDGLNERIPLKLSWPDEFFDKTLGKILPRFKDDKDYSDYTLMCDTEMGKVNEIFKEYRLGNKTLTIGQLVKEYNNYTSRKDFFTFFLQCANERYKRKKITKGTRNGHIATLNSLKDFWQWEHRTKNKKKKLDLDVILQLPFNAITPKNLENFRAWMKSDRANIPSTVENNMKNVRTYVKLALGEGNVFDDPFKVVKVTKPTSEPDALTQDQLHSLIALFNDKKTSDTWKNILRHFLFSCFTGLRISDAKAVSHENVKGEWLVIMPQKGLRYHRTVKIPLHPMAKNLIITSIGQLFTTYSEPYTNRTLAKIGEAAGVTFKITTHTARHSFGTLFIELDGDVVTLKEYMGHRDIGTTMKYVHISERRKKEKINVFDKLFPQSKQELKSI